jgi:hypothetical protein
MKMPCFGMLRRVALVRTDVSEERIAPIIKVKRISEQNLICRWPGSTFWIFT